MRIIYILMLLGGIILLYLSTIKKIEKKLKKPKLEKKQNEDLEELTRIVKKEIKKDYYISDKLSVMEIIGELEKRQIPFFIDVLKKIAYYSYKKEPNEKELKNLREKIEKEIEKKNKEPKKETFLEKLHENERKIKEKIRIEKIRIEKTKRSKKQDNL